MVVVVVSPKITFGNKRSITQNYIKFPRWLVASFVANVHTNSAIRYVNTIIICGNIMAIHQEDISEGRHLNFPFYIQSLNVGYSSLTHKIQYRY